MSSVQYRNEIIEEVAHEIEQMRLVGQKKPWWRTWWIYINEPMPHRDEIARTVRTLKTANK